MNNNRIKIFLILLISILFVTPSFSQVKLLIPMELSQTDHLKAYGIAYRHLLNNKELDWLLNYRGGSFLFNYSQTLEDECRAKGVSYELQVGPLTAQI